MTQALEMNIKGRANQNVAPTLPSFEAIEKVLVTGDLTPLNPQQRVEYYNRVCSLVGVNPTTKPFDYIVLNGKLVLYANKGCAEQLRSNWRISIQITNRQTIEGVYIVTARAISADGREDESTGAVPIQGVKGESLANAMMKAETKSKRRVTLSICSLNMLDDSEIESVRSQSRPEVPQTGPSLNQRITPKVEIEIAGEQGVPVVKGEDHQPWDVAGSVIPRAQDAGIDGEDLGGTVITVGGERSPLRGKTFAEIGKVKLEESARGSIAWHSKQGVKINAAWSDFFSKVEAYCGISLEG